MLWLRRHALPCTAALLLFLSLSLSAAGLGIAAAARRESKALSALQREYSRTLSAKMEALEARPSAREYLLRSFEGKLGVYSGDGQVLLELIEINVKTLPAADQAKLNAGIAVRGEEALRSLCEDFTS